MYIFVCFKKEKYTFPDTLKTAAIAIKALWFVTLLLCTLSPSCYGSDEIKLGYI